MWFLSTSFASLAIHTSSPCTQFYHFSIATAPSFLWSATNCPRAVLEATLAEASVPVFFSAHHPSLVFTFTRLFLVEPLATVVSTLETISEQAKYPYRIVSCKPNCGTFPESVATAVNHRLSVPSKRWVFASKPYIDCRRSRDCCR